MRKHIAWYLHGFPAGGDIRRALALVSTRAELDTLLEQLDQSAPFPEGGNGPRGRQGSPAKVSLPDGWLNDPDDCTVPQQPTSCTLVDDVGSHLGHRAW